MNAKHLGAWAVAAALTFLGDPLRDLALHTEHVLHVAVVLLAPQE